MKKVLITGARGLLGRALCEAFAEFWKVIAPSRNELDITRRDQVRQIFATERPVLVLHAAAYSAVDMAETTTAAAEEANIEGACNVAEAARESGAFPVYFSTDYIFNGTKGAPYSEDDSPAPLSVYGRTKLEGEKAFLKSPGHIIVRTSWLFGRGGKNFVDTVAGRLRCREKLRVVDDQVGSPTYVRDLAAGVRSLVEVGAKGTFHVTNSGFCSWYGLAVKLCEILKFPASCVEPVSSATLSRPARRPPFSVLDNGRFFGATGYRLPHWEDALSRYVLENLAFEK